MKKDNRGQHQDDNYIRIIGQRFQRLHHKKMIRQAIMNMLETSKKNRISARNYKVISKETEDKKESYGKFRIKNTKKINKKLTV